MTRRRGLLALVVVVLLIGAAGVFAVSRSRPAVPPGQFQIEAHCVNCGWEGTVLVPKGMQVNTVACPQCGVWVPPAPEGPGGEAAWEAERRSPLMSLRVWRSQQAANARK